MVIEQNKNEILIRVSKKIDIREIQDILNFLRYKELTSSHKVKQSVVDELATAINNKWLTKNKKRVGK
ncbi:MAG: hypothetical protein UZ12_BCD005001811 [Bacteroidetes bacterium OLB12]|nr:MAG: hypothetical protein UZ12_BCD005001811 [Bacteroidetes bacterium OLB12]HNU41011.1 hypothetical protein [Cyclobacteriaceae bacterium]